MQFHEGGGETGSMYVGSYQVRWYVEMMLILQSSKSRIAFLVIFKVNQDSQGNVVSSEHSATLTTVNTIEIIIKPVHRDIQSTNLAGHLYI